MKKLNKFRKCSHDIVMGLIGWIDLNGKGGPEEVTKRWSTAIRIWQRVDSFEDSKDAPSARVLRLFVL